MTEETNIIQQQVLDPEETVQALKTNQLPPLDQNKPLTRQEVMKIAQEAANNTVQMQQRKNDRFFPMEELRKKGWENSTKYFEYLIQQQQFTMKEALKEQIFPQIDDKLHEVRNQLSTVTSRMLAFSEVQQEVQTLTNQMRFKVSLLAFEDLKTELMKYANLSQFETFQSQIQFEINANVQLCKDLTVKMDLLTTKIKTIESQSNSQQKMLEKCEEKNTLLKKQLFKVQTELTDSQVAFSQETNKNFSDIKQILQTFTEEKNKDQYFLEARLANFATQKQIETVYTKLNSYVTKLDMKDQNKESKDMLLESKQMLLQFSAENSQTKEMIRRFDEILTQKVNKTSLMKFKVEISQNFQTKENVAQSLNQIDTRIEQLQIFVNSSPSFFNKLKSDVLDGLDKSIDQKLESRFISYDKVCQSFSKFFNQEYLTEVLQKKAEVSIVDQQMNDKVSTIDFEKCYTLIKQLYQRLKQQSIFFVELTRALVPGSKTSSSISNTETLQAKITKHEYLFKQAELALREVTQFSSRLSLDQNDQSYYTNIKNSPINLSKPAFFQDGNIEDPLSSIMSQSVDFTSAPHNFVSKYRIKSKLIDSSSNFRSTSFMLNEREIPKPFIPQKVSVFSNNFSQIRFAQISALKNPKKLKDKLMSVNLSNTSILGLGRQDEFYEQSMTNLSKSRSTFGPILDHSTSMELITEAKDLVQQFKPTEPQRLPNIKYLVTKDIAKIN